MADRANATPLAAELLQLSAETDMSAFYEETVLSVHHSSSPNNGNTFALGTFAIERAFAEQ